MSWVVVAGWLVNEHFARRAVRRNMRIEYLLSPYRRLEHASNREMTISHEAALEEAISDIQLLGSPKQVALATTFAREFASDQRADTEPLLEDLRSTLRKELQLDRVPPQRMWLRISRTEQVALGPKAGERSWAVWQERTQAVALSINAAGASEVQSFEVETDLRSASREVRELLALAERSAIGAIVACEQRIAAALSRLLVENGAGDVEGLNTTEMAFLAHERQLVNAATRDGVEGLGVMHTMALLDEGGRRLTPAQAREFIGLTEGVLLSIRMPPRSGGPR